MIQINDGRSQKEFTKISFSNYKKTDVIKRMIEGVRFQKIEESCYWCAELLCAGHYTDLWNTFFKIMCQYIHSGNPKLPIYLLMRYKSFGELANSNKFNDILELRNDIRVRTLFFEIICVLSLSTKKHEMTRFKIKEENYNIIENAHNLTAPHVGFGKLFMKQYDPVELLVPVNELAYSMDSTQKNTLKACFWVEWILKFANQKKKNKKIKELKKERLIQQKHLANTDYDLMMGNFINLKKDKPLPKYEDIKITKRNMPVDDKFCDNIVWIIWEVILHYSKKSYNKMVTEIINALFQLFCTRYTTSVNNKRILIIYQAITVLTDKMDFGIDVISHTQLIEKMKKNTDAIFAQIKTNECEKPISYMFANIMK